MLNNMDRPVYDVYLHSAVMTKFYMFGNFTHLHSTNQLAVSTWDGMLLLA